MKVDGETLGTIYFVRPVGLAGPIKIGFTTNTMLRLPAINAWAPFRLEIAASTPGTLRTENAIHRCFSECHSHGEWFFPTSRLIAAIEALATGRPLEEAIDFTKQAGPIRGKFPWTDDRRKIMSYRQRAAWLERRDDLFAPCEYDQILDAWCGYGRRIPIRPTAEQFARLDEILADPAKHCIPRAVRFPPPKSAEEIYHEAWLQ